MNANKTYSYLVRCKCPGKLGCAKVEVNYTEGRDAYEFFDWSWSHCARCWICRASLRFSQVSGKVTRHECGAKCMASKGPACECSCGGANHGKSWA